MTRFEQSIEQSNAIGQIEEDEFSERQNYGTYEESEEICTNEDFETNAPCDNIGYCVGTSCRYYFTNCN